MAAPLLARSFGEFMFAAISAVAFTTVLGTVSGLILAASGAVAHDLLSHGFGVQMTDHEKIRIAKITAVVVGIVGIGLGILFKDFNVTFLVGWAFNIAASANLPALVMLLFWPKTTRQGGDRLHSGGMGSSLTWCAPEQAGVSESVWSGYRHGDRAIQPARSRDDSAGVPDAGGGGVALEPAAGSRVTRRSLVKPLARRS